MRQAGGGWVVPVAACLLVCGCAPAPAPRQEPAAQIKKENPAMTEHFLNALRTHDITLPDRASDAPPDFLEQVARAWGQWDEESRDIAVSTAIRMRNRNAGHFLLKVATLPGEPAAASAAEALITHPEAPDGNTILAAAQPVKDGLTRAALYRAAGANQAAVAVFEPVAAKEPDPGAKQAALEALARLGHLPSLHQLYEKTAKAQAGDVLTMHDALVYVGDVRLAKALIPWLHATDPVSRLGSDRSPLMVRQCDYALWTAHLLSAGVTLPAPHIDVYGPAALSAAKPVLQDLPNLPPR